ncbi:hypothetical protein H0O01_02090 [Candidatus Micrarchaeota archaeon]|nr:hypothetical protein [Candidatus Micrarchaeota archaeon]
MIEVFKDLMLGVAQSYINEVVETTSEKINVKVDLIVAKVAVMMKEVLPAIIYSSLFYGVGMILFILGLGAYLDTIIGVQGAGSMIGGAVLLFLGLYYKMQLDKALAKLPQPK